MSEWRDIDTVPGDGRPVWVWDYHRPERAPWLRPADGAWWRQDRSEWLPSMPTHWMPLEPPTPPNGPAARSNEPESTKVREVG
jgi:hypothetical protein